MNGIILVDKSPGWTSFDVVNYIRKIIAEKENKHWRQIKVGHAGTLDPFASGLLIILIGIYTKKANTFSKLDKTYEFEVYLGKSSSTGDPEGEITKLTDVMLTKELVSSAVKSFKGDYNQIPPKYSAIKIKGQRSYKMARKNIEVIHESRPVKIHKIDVISYKEPIIKIRATVSSGTYIRVLSEDIAKKLNTVSYTSYLRRVAISKYKVNKSIIVKEITKENIEQLTIY